MSTEPETQFRHPLIRLLDVGLGAFSEELTRRVAETQFSDIRITHGCVFGNIDPDGTRLWARIRPEDLARFTEFVA